MTDWSRLEAIGPIGVDWGYDGSRYWVGLQLFGWRPTLRLWSQRR